MEFVSSMKVENVCHDSIHIATFVGKTIVNSRSDCDLVPHCEIALKVPDSNILCHGCDRVGIGSDELKHQ